VAEKQVSCQRLGSNPLVNDQNAGPEEKIPFSTCRLGDFARGSRVIEIIKVHTSEADMTP
jgi:hypothetical protein